MLWPYFSGEEPTLSEAACPADQVMGPALFDQMWRLPLPEKKLGAPWAYFVSRARPSLMLAACHRL